VTSTAHICLRCGCVIEVQAKWCGMCWYLYIFDQAGKKPSRYKWGSVIR